MVEQTLLERIKKLMALSHSSNPNEAAIALSRAQKLMQENEISSEDLEMSSFAEERIPTARGLRDSKISSALAHIVAKAFGLEFFRTVTSSSGNSTYITFIGPNERLKSGIYVYTILCRQVLIAKEQYKKEERENIRGEIISKLKKNFVYSLFSAEQIKAYISKETTRLLSKKTKIYLEGWLYSIRQKVEDFVSPPEEHKLLSDFMQKNHPDLKYSRGRSRSLSRDELEAYKLGKFNGSHGIELFQGIGGMMSRRLQHKKEE